MQESHIKAQSTLQIWRAIITSINESAMRLNYPNINSDFSKGKRKEF